MQKVSGQQQRPPTFLLAATASPSISAWPFTPGLELGQTAIIRMWTSVWPCSELNTATEERHSCIGKTEPLYSGWQQGTLDIEFALLSGEVATVVPVVCPFALCNRNPNFHLRRLWGQEMRSLALGLSLLSSFEADETGITVTVNLQRHYSGEEESCV